MEEAKKPTRDKSPMYPSIGLKSAVAKVKGLYDKAGKNFVPRKLAAEAMGYKSESDSLKSLSGSALTLLSSLYQYGLVIRKTGEIGISDETFTILHAPEGSSDKAEALAKCGSRPKIFREIHDKYADKLPSDSILIWYLQQRKYSRQAAETIVACYKETVEYANLSEKWPIADTEETANVTEDTGVLSDTGQTNASKPQVMGTPGIKPVILTCPCGEKTASITITGGKPSKDEMDSLISMLEAFKKTLPIEPIK